MHPIGTKVKLYTNPPQYVLGFVTSDPVDEGKQWVTALPGNQKDDESLQADASPVLSGPGSGRYEHEPL